MGKYYKMEQKVEYRLSFLGGMFRFVSVSLVLNDTCWIILLYFSDFWTSCGVQVVF